jgi:hypothetical protein
MLSRSVCTVVLLVFPVTVRAQHAPTQTELDSISARGRALAAYQHAAWTASTQLIAKNPHLETVQRYVVYHADSGWVVAFGRMNSSRDTFYVSNIGIPASVNGARVDSIFEFVTFDQPGPDVDYLVRASARQHVRTVRRRFRPKMAIGSSISHPPRISRTCGRSVRICAIAFPRMANEYSRRDGCTRD